MNDDKYLIKRNGVYYIRVQNPPPEWGFKKEFKHTLRTGNIKIARELRNKYLWGLCKEYDQCFKHVDYCNVEYVNLILVMVFT